MAIEGFTEYKKEDKERYNRLRWWLGMTWGDVFTKATDIYPEKEGLVDNQGRWRYSELRRNVDRLAIGLIRLGIRPKDMVLIQLPNWREYIYTFFAFQKIGAIPGLLIPRHGQPEIKYLCRLTRPVAWVLPERYGRIEYQPIIEDVLKENPQLTHIIKVRAEDKRYPSLEGIIEETEPTEGDMALLEERRPDPDEVGFIMLTGGTTGLPKAVPRTHNSYITNVEYHSRAWEITSNDTILVMTPAAHSMAMHWGIGAAFFNYAKLVLLDSTKAEDICECIQRERITAIPSVPALIARMMNMEGIDRYDLSSLKKICLGGAPSTPELIRTVYERLGCTVINSLGSSEGTNISTRPYDSIDIICNSVGRPACPYDTIRIIDPNGKDVPPGIDGELVSKGPGIFTGYFKSPEENKETFTPDGFFKTGDMARRDEQGNITITGKIKDIINRGGEKISALEIENLLNTHPKIKDSAVVGMPDPIMGERICAYVVLKGDGSLNLEELIQYLKGKGASVQQLPERLEYIDELPMTKLGKVDKKWLREDIKRRLGLKG